MVLNFGMYSDSGTAWEAGFAAALEIPVIQVLCGFENCTYSLMMMNGCDKIIHAENVAFWESECACVSRDKIIQK
jgi:nucleoside 2-deoxyribosyltransferase